MTSVLVVLPYFQSYGDPEPYLAMSFSKAFPDSPKGEVEASSYAEELKAQFSSCMMVEIESTPFQDS